MISTASRARTRANATTSSAVVLRRTVPVSICNCKDHNRYRISGRDNLSTVLDDYSRYILARTLRASMQPKDVTETLDLARAAVGGALGA